MKRNGRFLKVFDLPKYSPSLNEVEHVNRQLKRDVCANLYHGSLKDLGRAVREYLKNYNIVKIG